MNRASSAIRNQGRGRGSSSSNQGRGSGRGRGSSSSNQGRGGRSGRDRGSSSSNRNKSPLLVYTSNFDTMYEKCKELGIVDFRFKVHKPNCSCNRLVSRLKDAKRLEYVDESSSVSQSSSEYGVSLQHLREDSLILHPDTKGIPCIFRWPIMENIADGDGADMLLRAEQSLQDHLNNYRFSCWEFSTIVCAACSLEEEPNGFACVMSSDRDVVQSVCDLTRQRIIDSSEEGRAKDHGDFIVILPSSLLHRLRASIQARGEQEKAGRGLQIDSSTATTNSITEEVMAHIMQQDISLPEAEERERVELSLGHHLDALLLQMPDRKKKNVQEAESSPYWLLLNGFIKDNKKNRKNTTNSNTNASSIKEDSPSNGAVAFLEFDLPGGKRRLGETSLQTAIRESQEEMSLVWDERWVIRIYQNHSHPFEKVNRVYVLRPPPLT
eukprot:scaffold22615_cov97-Cylindrotheca_fusiformis.AAC.2